MKNSKLGRALLLVACAVLLVSLSVGATLAYLTSQTGVVTNTFTVGSVNITLDEYKVDEYGVADTTANRVQANTYKLIPGHTYTKDPIVHVAAGSEICYLYVKVTNDIAAIEADPTIAVQMEANGWHALEGVPGVYYYGTTVDARKATKDVDVVVFENFKIKTDADISNYAGKTVTITAYAIQADGFEDKTFAEIWAIAQFN